MPKIIGYYPQMTVPVMRRLIAPSNTLSSRGKPVYYSFTPRVGGFNTTAYHGVMLPDWSTDGKLPPCQGVYLYDLSDAVLLDDPNVVNVLSQCAAVTVPSDGILRRVKPLTRRAVLIPSMVHRPWLFGAPRLKSDYPLVACFGNYDWEPLVPVLEAYLKRHSQVRILTNVPALIAGIKPNRIYLAQPELERWPTLIQACFLHLAPAADRTTDPVQVFEFGTAGVPSIVGPAFAPEVDHGRAGVVAGSRADWGAALDRLTDNDGFRARIAQAAIDLAGKNSTTKLADGWFHAMGKLCATALAPATLA